MLSNALTEFKSLPSILLSQSLILRIFCKLFIRLTGRPWRPVIFHGFVGAQASNLQREPPVANGVNTYLPDGWKMGQRGAPGDMG